MKLRIASDFHLEFYDYKSMVGSKSRDINEHVVLPIFGNEKEQVLILAGDIIRAYDINDNQHRMEFLFDNFSKRFAKVIIVAGNHEHYSFNFKNTTDVLRKFYAKWENFEFCENNIIEFGETVIFGATLWTDFNKGDPFAIGYAKSAMSDFAGAITYGSPDMQYKQRFTPELSIISHEETLFHMNEFFWKLPNPKKIVVTHHAPSGLSTAERFKGSTLNAAFSSNLEEYILDREPILWVHGHMHNNSDYMIGKTRIICNPYGYYSENTKDYINNLIIEV